MLTKSFSRILKSYAGAKTWIRQKCHIPAIVMNNGLEMPLLGLGTWGSTNDYICTEKPKDGTPCVPTPLSPKELKKSHCEVAFAVKNALDCGYRHIDCAFVYNNQPVIGRVLQEELRCGDIKRDELFITSKLWNTYHDPDDVCSACFKTLQDFGFDYLDMYLMHSPMGYQRQDRSFPSDAMGDFLFSDVHFIETWKAMEDLVKNGMCKSIGISNFNQQQVEELLDHCTIVPQTLQIELHPFLTQKELIKFCHCNAICITAYAPLGSGDRPWKDSVNDRVLLEEPHVRRIARRHNRTPAQVLLRYLVQLGVAAIPKAVLSHQIEENIKVFDFELLPEDMDNLESLNYNFRYFVFSGAFGHPLHPFEERKRCRYKIISTKPKSACKASTSTYAVAVEKAIMSEVPTKMLSSGFKMPVLGLGTWNSPKGEVTRAVKDAIDVGYRHIDCAHIYQNENEVGDGIEAKICEGVVTRDELFVTSKLWNTFHRPDLVRRACETTLKNLKLSYLNMYLIHWPMGYKEGAELFPVDKCGKVQFSDVDYLDTWKEMEKLVTDGLVKSIGVSNFNKCQIERVLSIACIPPACNQIECHPYLNQKKLMEYCNSKNIAVVAYSPLGSPQRPMAVAGEKVLMDDPVIVCLAKKLSKTTAQILIRYQVQRGNIVIPKSVTKGRIESNINVFDFNLSQEDMESIDCLNNNHRLVPLLDQSQHPHHPFARDEF